MPEKKSSHLWIWIAIALIVVVVIVVIFFIKKDQNSFNEVLQGDLLENMTAPEYNYSEEDRITIQKEIEESNNAFMNAFSTESSGDIEISTENEAPIMSDEDKGKVQKSNEEFMNLFNQSNL